HRGLAGAGGELERKPHQFRIGVFVRCGEMIEQAFAPGRLGRDFGQPDRGFRGLDLTEERTYPAEFMMAPMLEETGSLRRYLPLGWAQRAPRVDMTADLVDDRGRIVLLLLGRKALAFVENKSRLRRGFALLRLGDRRNEFGAASIFDDALGRL